MKVSPALWSNDRYLVDDTDWNEFVAWCTENDVETNIVFYGPRVSFVVIKNFSTFALRWL